MKSAIRMRAWMMALAVMLAVPSLALANARVYPGISGYGGVHALPQAAVQPDPGAEYKAIFDVTSHAKDPSKINPGVMHVIRAVNVFASAHVPLSHLHFVVILHGPSTPVALSDNRYRKQFGTDNPNIPMLRKLKAAGVKIYVCGQAMYDFHYPLSWADKDVSVALSALSTLVIYGDQGYAFVKQ